MAFLHKAVRGVPKCAARATTKQRFRCAPSGAIPGFLVAPPCTRANMFQSGLKGCAAQAFAFNGQHRGAGTTTITTDDTAHKGIALLSAASRAHEPTVEWPNPMLELGGTVLVDDAVLEPITDDMARKGIALLSAASRSHEQPTIDMPEPLLELGGTSLVEHALWQLNSARFETVLVVLGHQGEEVRKRLMDHVTKEKNIFEGLRLEFVDLGSGWRGGHAATVAAAGPKLQEISNGSNMVIVGSDHIFTTELLEKASNMHMNGDDAAVLVETNIDGMLGLPSSTVFCAMRPLHGKDHVVKIGQDLETYSGIDAGLTVLTPATLQRVMDHINSTGGYVSDVLAKSAQRGTLRMLKTEGHTWFGVETETRLKEAEERFTQTGQEYELSDGRKINLVGLPKKVTSGGGEWAEFSVEKWRSAVYTAASFFEQLFVDTTDFVGELCDELGGGSEEGPLLVEVGCGTGEALLPLIDRAAHTVGMDFNPHFIEFCEQNVPEDQKDRIQHLVGDAQELIPLLDRELDPKWTKASRPKVVICVGNTAGILPPDVRQKTYQQMKDLAGKNGFMVIVYWNGNAFGDAVQHFYNKNPQLCGKFKGASIDLDTCTLTTPSGYCTHWTKPEEARDIFENEIGVEVVHLAEMGRGVLIAGRVR